MKERPYPAKVKIELNNFLYAVESNNHMAEIIHLEGNQNAPICCTPYWNTLATHN